MIPTGQDSLHTRSTLEVAGKTYAYYSLAKAAEAIGDISRLPFSMKVLFENLLRFEDGRPSLATTFRRWSTGRANGRSRARSSIGPPGC